MEIGQFWNEHNRVCWYVDTIILVLPFHSKVMGMRYSKFCAGSLFIVTHPWAKHRTFQSLAFFMWEMENKHSCLRG